MGDALTLSNEKQKDSEEAPSIALELAHVALADGETSLPIRSTKEGGLAAEPVLMAPRKDPRIVETDRGTLATLGGFGPDGATLAEWRRPQIALTTPSTKAATG
jgi:hypothetical protein